MSRRDNWEPEDGMGFAGLVPTAAEKSQERYDERMRQQIQQMRIDLAASEQRNRELQARIKHMEELCAIYDAGLFELAPITCGAIRAACATPAQPAAGEEIDCVRCGNKHSGGC